MESLYSLGLKNISSAHKVGVYSFSGSELTSNHRLFSHVSKLAFAKSPNFDFAFLGLSASRLLFIFVAIFVGRRVKRLPIFLHQGHRSILCVGRYQHFLFKFATQLGQIVN